MFISDLASAALLLGSTWSEKLCSAASFPHVTVKGTCRWHNPRLWLFSLTQTDSLGVEPFVSWHLGSPTASPWTSELWEAAVAKGPVLPSPGGPFLPSPSCCPSVFSPHSPGRTLTLTKEFENCSSREPVRIYPCFPETEQDTLFPGTRT